MSKRSEGEREGELSTKLDDMMLAMRGVESELLQVRELVGVLVRSAETKAEMVARRLTRMEQGKDEVDDAEHEADIQEALTNQAKVVRLVVDKWFVDKGYGFGKTTTGEIVFIHASVVQGAGSSWSGLTHGRKSLATMFVPRGGIEHEGHGDETRGDKRGTKKRRTRWPSK